MRKGTASRRSLRVRDTWLPCSTRSESDTSCMRTRFKLLPNPSPTPGLGSRLQRGDQQRPDIQTRRQTGAPRAWHRMRRTELRERERTHGHPESDSDGGRMMSTGRGQAAGRDPDSSSVRSIAAPAHRHARQCRRARPACRSCGAPPSRGPEPHEMRGVAQIFAASIRESVSMLT